MLKLIALMICFSSLRSEVLTEVIDQAQKWHAIQQQLVSLYLQHQKISENKLLDNREFFSIQQQLGAIYLAQKRYQIGFGTAILPSKKAVLNYVRKKSFLNLKTKEIMPLYKQYVQEYQKKYAGGDLERMQKHIKQLEALNLLHRKLFEQLEQERGGEYWADPSKITKISSIKGCIEKLPAGKPNKKANCLLSWITPVAGVKQTSSKGAWKPLAGAVVICPDAGTVTSIGRFENRIVIFLTQHRFTYVIEGLEKCCVSVGDKLRQGQPLGSCADNSPSLVELHLWQDNIALDPEPYHRFMQL